MSPILLAATGQGLARAAQVNGHWAVAHLLPDQGVTCLSADPLHPGVVYAGTQGGGVWRSEDDGATWRRAGLAGRIVKAIAASPSEPNVVYSGTKPAQVFVSRDGGSSWTELEGFRRVRAFWWFSPAQPPFAAQVVGHLHERVAGDLVSRRDLGDGGALPGLRGQVDQHAQAVVGKGGELHGESCGFSPGPGNR